MGSHLRRATSYEKDDQKGRKIPTRHSNEAQVDTCVIPNATATSRCADWSGGRDRTRGLLVPNRRLRPTVFGSILARDG